MALRIRRGTNAQRTSVAPFDMGEIVWTTDTEKLYVGDGITSGGKNILASSAGNGLVFNPTTQRLDVGNFNITTDEVTEGTQPGRQYFTVERAQAAAASLFTTGAHTGGISFTYQDANNRIDAAVSMSLDSLTDVVITGTPTTGYVLKYDGVKWAPAPDTDTDIDTGILAVVEDVSPELGGNLSLNGHNIVGTGNLNFTGNFDLVGNGVETGNITAPGSLQVTGTIETIGGFNSNVNLNGNNITGAQNITLTGNILSSSFKTSTAKADIYGITSGVYSADMATVSINGSKGTLAVPTNTGAGDFVSRISFNGYRGTDYTSMGSIMAQWAPGANFTDPFPASSLNFVINAGGETKVALFDSSGAFYAPILAVGSYNGAMAYPATPAGLAGAIIFDSDSKKFMGWDGTTWNILG